MWYQVNTEPILPISIPIPVTYKSSSCRRAVSELAFFLKTWNVIVPVSKALQDNFCCLNRLQIKQTRQSTGKGSDIFFHSACSRCIFSFPSKLFNTIFQATCRTNRNKVSIPSWSYQYLRWYRYCGCLDPYSHLCCKHCCYIFCLSLVRRGAEIATNMTSQFYKDTLNKK